MCGMYGMYEKWNTFSNTDNMFLSSEEEEEVSKKKKLVEVAEKVVKVAKKGWISNSYFKIESLSSKDLCDYKNFRRKGSFEEGETGDREEAKQGESIEGRERGERYGR